MATRAATAPIPSVASDADGKGPWALFKRAFSADRRLGFAVSTGTATTSFPDGSGSLSDADLSNAIFIASGARRMASSGSHYKHNADRIRADLISAKERLEAAVERHIVSQDSALIRRKEHDLALFTLAQMNAELGEYSAAHAIYDDLVPPTGDSIPVFLQEYGKHRMETTIQYLRFQANTRRDLDHALELGLTLRTVEHTSEESYALLFALNSIYNARGDFEAAQLYKKALEDFMLIDAIGKDIYNQVSLQTIRAVTAAGLGRQSDAKHPFLSALIQSAVILGMWHRTTLKVLLDFGNSLRNWGDHQAAATMLGECCLGRYHRLGKLHPAAISTYTDLKLCKDAEPQLEALRRFLENDTGQESKFAVAYEHIYLNTIIELLVSAGLDPSLEETEIILKTLLDTHKTLKVETAEHRAIFVLRIHRALARCNYKQGKIEEAIKAVEGMNSSTQRSVEGTFQSNLDLVLFHHENPSTKSKAAELSRSIFFEVDKKLNRDQARAFQRQLSALGCTHFTTSGPTDTLPIKPLENIGTGAYAIVESVEVSSRLYARKSIALPRYNQTRIRQTIQNEISVIRALAHPHIVQVYCTYEEKSRFAIILQPLASCDLEMFLEQHTQPADTDSLSGQYKLLWKWLRCLANTLAFIHSKGIRHKDIKTRNILVKDFEVIYADFGSSHAFLDEGTSVTEGPAFGHTLMYCAPEVISWEKRSRSADIFSLGCVFTEIATSLDGRAIADFYDFRCKSDEMKVHAYHATLDLVQEWFKEGRASEEVGTLYRDVVEPMLAREPEARPSASTTGDKVNACFKDITGEWLNTCSKCYPMQWDPDDVNVDGDGDEKS